MDQTSFAALSGDCNPIHVDAVAARRIGAGAQVVHGVHNLLWCLDEAVSQLPNLRAATSLRVNFDNFVTVGQTVDLAVVSSDAARLKLEVRLRDAVSLTALVGFGEEVAEAREETPAEFFNPDQPLDIPIADLSGLTGKLPFARTPSALSDKFPHATRLFGARRLTALGTFTRLIGMVCPGLHSIFNRITLRVCGDVGMDGIYFRVTDANREHRRVACTVWGGGWPGTLIATMRHPPTLQPSMAEMSRLVQAEETRQVVALVVGGSRGIGEATAKLIAAGGGTAIITYASGQGDARRVADEIVAWGGRCKVMQLDVKLPIAEQVRHLEETPNQLYYFATPMIGGRKSQIFEPARLREFLDYYVNGFYECCQALLDKRPAGLVALYPSSVFVAERPAGVAEYAMAKAAGEELCRDMNDQIASLHVVVSRLPRLATDQNPGLSRNDVPSVGEVILPLVREVCAISASWSAS